MPTFLYKALQADGAITEGQLEAGGRQEALRQMDGKGLRAISLAEKAAGKAKKPEADGSKAIEAGGRIIHEVGGALMGADAKKSVTNRWNQCWDVPNLVLNDGSAFCSNADKNPTLTIMALAWRASDHLVEEMRKGNL